MPPTATPTPKPEAADFFRGKTMRLIVAFSPGGGYDAYTRLLGRHMGKYLPGDQDFVVQNMPGAGGLRATNYLASTAKPDGLTAAHLSRESYFAQFTEQPGVNFDIREFPALGSATFENRVFWMRKDLSPGQTLQELADATKAGEEVFIGATGPGSSAFALWNTAELLMPDLDVELVMGYPGSTEIHLAVRKGEVMGYAQSKSSFLIQTKDLAEENNLLVLAQIGTPTRERDPDFPDAPTLWELADEKIETAAVSVVAAASVAGRPFFLPPGVPEDRVTVLRDAFMKAMQDEELLAEAENIGRPIEPVPGEEIARLNRDVFDVTPQERQRITNLVTGG